MSISRFLILILFFLPGCAGMDGGLASSGWSWPFPAGGNAVSERPRGGARGAEFSFDWHLAGDPEIMPVQVFDDGAGMWLQFPPDGAWPAVFDADASGRRPLSYRRERPYMVLDAVYEHLELRGGSLRGSVRKAAPADTAVVSEPSPVALPEQQPALQAAAPAVSALNEAAPPSVVPGTAVEIASAGESRARQADYLGTPVVRYAVSPADITMRQALGRWAAASGWAFSAEHWAVDVDIPLVGEASFHTDFKSAVRELLAATEMGDRPLQPCFYSNRVLRVVAHAQACDRRSGMGTVS